MSSINPLAGWPMPAGRAAECATQAPTPQPAPNNECAAQPQPEVGQNTGSARPDPGPADLPASAGACAAAKDTPDGANHRGAAPWKITAEAAVERIGITLHNSGTLTIATEEAVVELAADQVLALGDFLTLTERFWRP